MVLPQDYVNYRRIARVGTDGLERPLYPTRHTSNPFAITQTADGTYSLDIARRKVIITIPANGASDINDGDFISFIWSVGSSPTRLHLIFDKDNDIIDGIATTSITSVKTGISLTGGETQQQVVDALVARINALSYYTVTDLGGGAIQVEYPAGISVSSSSVNTASTEGIYPAGATGGAEANTTNMVMAVTANGIVSGETLLEQTPSNT